jgi:hypothetical protein
MLSQTPPAHPSGSSGESSALPGEPLTFSLVINTTDRADSLKTLLIALEQQSYPHFEVIVVVGPTSDHTMQVLAPYQNRLRVLQCPHANLSQSRNIGLQAAHGEIVAYTDDDATPSVRWLEQLAWLFANPHLAGTGGIVYLVHPKQPLIQHRIGIASNLAEQQDVQSSWLDSLALQNKTENLGVVWCGRMMGANMAFRRTALLSIGGFDEFYEWVYDDTDIAMRLATAGYVVQPVQAAAVYHVPASSRNRSAYTYTGRWWVQTKAAIYFCLQNGKTLGQSRGQLLLRCAHLLHGHWLWYRQLWSEGKISLRQFAQLQGNEVRGAAAGCWAGLASKRRLLPQLNPKEQEIHAIQPYQTMQSAQQATVDPISGRQPSIQLNDPPLRICLLSRAYPPQQYEGVGRHTNLMARGLFELGHSVHVISEGEREQVTFYDGAYVHRIVNPLNRYQRFRSAPLLFHALNYSHALYEAAQKMIVNDGIELIDSPLWQLDGLVAAQSRLLPVVVRAQTALRQVAALQREQGDDARLVGELEEKFLAMSTYLVANSQATVKTLASVYGMADAARISVIAHGIQAVADEAIRPYDAQNRGVQTGTNDLTVLYVGRLEKRKGILDLFAAIPLALAKVANVRFIIAGADNSRSDGFFAQQGMDYPAFFASRYAKFAQAVEFLGAVSEERLQQLYQDCNLFVAPSLYESFGLIYLEAMNYAKPVIGCWTGGVPEVVEDGVTGYLVEPEAPAQLAERMVQILHSPTQLRSLGLAGRQRLLDRFTHVHMARQFAELYRRIIALPLFTPADVYTPHRHSL